LKEKNQHAYSVKKSSEFASNIVKLFECLHFVYKVNFCGMPKQKNKARMIFNNAVKNSNDMQHALN
jgi:hypothetical protein